jgi:hypothetical protein
MNRARRQTFIEFKWRFAIRWEKKHYFVLSLNAAGSMITIGNRINIIPL